MTDPMIRFFKSRGQCYLIEIQESFRTKAMKTDYIFCIMYSTYFERPFSIVPYRVISQYDTNQEWYHTLSYRGRIKICCKQIELAQSLNCNNVFENQSYKPTKTLLTERWRFINWLIRIWAFKDWNFFSKLLIFWEK